MHLVPFYCYPHADVIPNLTRSLAETFGLTVEEHPPRFDPESAHDPTRGQYNSRIILSALLRDVPGDGSRVLGVTALDLFIPVLTYVFGEAQLDGQAAVVSMYRLDDTLYGMPPSPDLLLDRLVKEANHELGHTYGLLHCRNGRCVMAASPQVAGIDTKSAEFCRGCRAELDRALLGGR